MNNLKLKNGSIDIIRGVDNNYYFLEVNPVGQFGMVSNPCNYNIEEKFALKLIELQNEKKFKSVIKNAFPVYITNHILKKN